MSTKLKAFAVFDGKIGSFMRPFFDAHTGSALRSFEEACKEPTSPFAKFAADFVLYQVGEFDCDSGRMSDVSPPHQLATALEIVRRPVVAEVKNA